MSLEAYFRIASYGLAATAFASLAMTGEVDPLSIVLYALALIICFTADARGVKRLRLREWMWRALAIAYVPLVFVGGAVVRLRVMAPVVMAVFACAADFVQGTGHRGW